MDKSIKGKIISALRKLTYAYSPRNDAKNAQKKAPATFECESCNIWVYTGAKSLSSLQIKPEGRLIKGKVYLDHIEPIVPLEGFSESLWDWNVYLDRMFCEQEGFQVLCEQCNQSKTYLENKLRKEYRNRKKDID